jgi:glutamate---methylamine ligase
VRGSEFSDLKTLPTSLLEALRYLEQDDLLLATLGQQAARTYLEFKSHEWAAHSAEVTDWEVNQYLNV